MKGYKCSILLGLLLMVTLIGGCAKNADDPDMKGMGTITVCSREEGSGTRAEFEKLLNVSGEKSDASLDSTDALVKAVGKDQNAIGYAAYHTALQNENVKVLAIDGVLPTDKTIKSEKYALDREFQLSYQEELSAPAADFLSYIMSAGQNIVTSYAIPVKKAGTFLSDRSEGDVTIEGSSSAAELLQALADDYRNYNDKVKITIHVTDSSDGITKAMQKKCDLAMSSRSLKDYEAELLESTVIARDGIAVIVNGKNPLSGLSKTQLKRIYNKETTEWKHWNGK